MTVTEKVAYLKGLMDGLKLDESSDQTKVIKAIVDVVDDIALSICDLEDGYAELCEQIDAIDEDLDCLEQDFYEDEEDDECDCCCDDDDEEDEYYYEVTCNKCGETLCLDEDTLLSGPISCPGCGELIEFDVVDCDECEDDCCDCCAADAEVDE